MESASSTCPFCEIAAGRLPTTIVASDRDTIAFLDLRQFHPGHVLVIPREHVADIRVASAELAASIGAMVARVSRAVDAVFQSDGLSIWHSAGEGANQEVPHLHFHIHSRRTGDGMLRIYPSSPSYPDRAQLEEWGERLRAHIR